jgi:4-hydroxybenzoate polyprenyltransferase
MDVTLPLHVTRWKLWLRALRLHQWLKNALVFVPLVAAHVATDLSRVKLALIAFLAFGLCASSVYLLNDLIDVEHDRHHRTKRLRPFASGQLSTKSGWFAMPVPLLLSILISLAYLPPLFCAALAGYFLLTLGYTLWFKRLMMIDVVVLTLLYTLRIIGGAYAVVVPMSFWLLTFSMFIFMSLALVKRYTELLPTRNAGAQEPLRGRGYTSRDIEMMVSLGTAAGYLSVMVLALYIQDGGTHELYRHPNRIWPACPLLLFWISRVWMLAGRDQMADDPVVFALKDHVSLAIVVLMMACFAWSL